MNDFENLTNKAHVTVERIVIRTLIKPKIKSALTTKNFGKTE